MSSENNKKGSTLKKIAIAFLLLFGVAVAAGSVFIMSILMDTPDIDPNKMIFTENSLIYDSNGKVTEKLESSGSSRDLIKSLDDVPENLKNAVLAIEDHTFYEHSGINIKRIFGAVVKNLKAGYKAEGASTITQQLAKNLYLTNEKTYKRKIKEVYYSFQLEKELTKDEILVAYLNTMSLGQGSRGVKTAAAKYFNKDVKDLSLAQCALIAGITKYPSKYAAYTTSQLTLNDDIENAQILIYAQDYVPTDDDKEMYEKLLDMDKIDKLTYDALKKGRKVVYKAEFNPKSKERQEVVLQRMLELGYISDSEYNEAINEEIKIELGGKVKNDNSTYFNSKVKKDVIKALIQEGYTEDEAETMLYNGGLRIYSTINSDMQDIVEKEYANGNNFPGKYIDDDGNVQPQSAMVIMDNNTGEIKAMIGGRGIGGESLYNRAINPRQPGSSIKPLAVYLPLMERTGMTPASNLKDEPLKKVKGEDWPRNAGGNYHGTVGMSTAVKHSYNAAAVRGAAMLGNSEEESMKIVQQALKDVGITTADEAKHYPAVLGGMDTGISPLEMTAAYATIANGGVYVEPITFTKIELSDGSILLENKPKKKRVYSENTAYYMTKMLEGAVNGGTGRSARISGMAVAGKTGTTNSNRDAWFCGYTPYYTASVWIGNDKGKKSIYKGSATSAALWRKIMSPIHEDLENRKFDKEGPFANVTVSYREGATGSIQKKKEEEKPKEEVENTEETPETPEETPETPGDGTNPEQPPTEGQPTPPPTRPEKPTPPVTPPPTQPETPTPPVTPTQPPATD